MRPWALQELQARHQARAQAPAQRGVRRRPQGDLHQDQRKPQEGRQARGQEVVLHAHPRVRSLLELWRNAQIKALTNRQSSLLALYIYKELLSWKLCDPPIGDLLEVQINKSASVLQNSNTLPSNGVLVKRFSHSNKALPEIPASRHCISRTGSDWTGKREMEWNFPSKREKTGNL